MRKAAFIFMTILLLNAAPARAGSDVPERVITAAPNLTEIAFAVGAGERIVGVTDFCDPPPGAKEKERIGGYLNPHVEKIIALKPDLVIFPKTRSDLPQRLEKLRINVAVLPNETVEDALNNIEAIAKLTGNAEQGAKLRGRIEEKLADLKDHRVEAAKALFVVSRSPDSLKNMYVAAPGTFPDELMELAGAENVVPPQASLYPKLSKESIITMNPELIFDASFAGADYTTKSLNAAREPWDRLSSVEAVKKGRVYLLTDPAITVQGPGLAESVEKLSALIHEREGKFSP